MLKAIFEFLTEPLGLPIAWYWEYIILVVIEFIARNIAYNMVGELYNEGFIFGSAIGSFLHWLIRLFVFAVIWAFAYGSIWLVKQIFTNWQIILIALGVIAGVTGLCALAIFVLRKYNKSKAASNDA